MTSYAELLYLIGAMMVFAMLTLNTSRTFNSTRQTIYQAEAEYRAIAVAQDEIDKIQWIYNSDQLDPDNGDYVYEDYPIKETHVYGDNDQYSTDFKINGTSELIFNDGSMKRYQVTITVVDPEAQPAVSVTLDYVKSYND